MAFYFLNIVKMQLCVLIVCVYTGSHKMASAVEHEH